jgi:hypothetical protein
MEGSWGGPHARIERVIGVVEHEKPQILGLQEATPQQIGWLKTALGKLGYKSFPKNRPVETSVFVDTNRFDVKAVDIIRNPTYADGPGKATGYMVGLTLKDKLVTDEAGKPIELNVLNSHPVAHDTTYDRGGAMKRWLTNKLRVQWAKRILTKNPEANVIDMGDNNQTNMLRLVADKFTPIVKDTWLKLKFGANQGRDKLAYCMLTQTGLLPDTKQTLLQDSLDAVRGMKGWCKDRSMQYIRHFNVDWVFKSKNLVVTKWQQIWNNLSLTASDHKPVEVDMYASNASDEPQQP